MKRNIPFFAILATLVFTGIIGARPGGGYTGPSIGISTIQEAKKMPDESPVALEGKIECFAGDEKYVFTGGNDTIVVEIDNGVWRGLSIGAADVVVIYGEVDKNFGRIKIEVDKVVRK
ncbi:MAG: NirD/YgiW/YdeI family stress tolerance protein [Treponema sp.]|jgi:uncharacterized protein (TIGR00156 family)|nr:NirD/YgiW/YdeI family stress tolerance protein [Treponema sp.]